MQISLLKETIKKAPNDPGVYIFKTTSGSELYVGKASSLKKRLTSYLKTEDPRILKMIDTADKVEFLKTDSDIEAMILESQLIKKQRPQFNIMLRDDKQYFFVAFSQDKFPRIYLTHQPTAETSAVGPFTDGAALKSTLRYLRNVFPYCTCKQSHHNYCLNYHIGKCLGFCCLHPHTITNEVGNAEGNRSFGVGVKAEVTAEQKTQYAKNIKAIKEILNGRKTSLIKELKKEMDQTARADKLDKAIEIRNQIEKLERVFQNAQIIKNSEIIKTTRSELQKITGTKRPIIRIEGYDISNIQGTHATGSMVTFVHGQPDKNYYRKFNIHPHTRTNEVKNAEGNRSFGVGVHTKWGDVQMLQQVLQRRFNHDEWPFPDLILIDGGKGQVSAALATLAALNIQIPIIGLTKDQKHFGKSLTIKNKNTWKIVPLDKLPQNDKNLLLSVDEEAHRFALSHYRYLHRKSL